MQSQDFVKGRGVGRSEGLAGLSWSHLPFPSLSLSGRREEAGFTLRKGRTQLCPYHHDLFQDDLVIFQINRDECWKEVAETENLRVDLRVRSPRFAQIRPPGCLLSSILLQVRGTRTLPLAPRGRVALPMAAASCVWERN